MKRILFWVLGAGAVCGAVALAVVAWIVFQPGPTDFAGGHAVELSEYKGPSPVGVPAEVMGADIVIRGKYLTEAADCEACHTKPDGVPYAGGRAFKLPFGTLYTPNITPDRETGIGQWSDADFLTAVHKGIAPDGSMLYPAFPYASYTQLPDEDVLAIKAYLFSLKPVHQGTQQNTFAFPYNQRWLMWFWSAFFNSDQRFKPVQEQSPEWNRGAYLVEALAHCGECHTPRNLMQAMNTRQKFAGGQAEGWDAYNITPDGDSGVGDWSAADLANYLSKGHAAGRGTASGPMREAIELSLSKLTATDIRAMVTYLRTVPPIKVSGLPKPAEQVSEFTGDNTDVVLGRQIFQGNCASCHVPAGDGALIEQARLLGNRAVNDPSGINVVQMILSGAGKPASGHPYMPSFGASYSNAEIAAVTNYLTGHFGSRPSKVNASTVQSQREQN